ncbi:YihY/virulence factor BrkB family protein [Ruminococcaceae bacterium OttesenSCG-928-A16]|nr:YihY/virulence factor BrkB family protein [Ruminococcaceae bacterium OttesenSCG-928-A16]
MSAKDNKVVKWVLIFKTRFTQAEVSSSSVIVAYYLLLSLFPLLIAVGNILPMFNITPQSLLPYLNIIVPASLQSVLDPIVVSLLTTSSGGLFSISAIGLVWSASRGIGHLQKCMNKAYGVEPESGLVVKKGISLLMVLVLLLLMVAFVLVFSVGQVVLDKLSEVFLWAEHLVAYLNDFKWPVAIVVIFVVLMLVYRITPDVKLRLRDVWPGSLVGLVGLLALTQLFTVYLQFVAGRVSSYGALGTFIVLMFWLNFSAIIILSGTILNATLYEYKYGKAQPQNSRLDQYLRQKAAVRLAKLQKKLPPTVLPKETGPEEPQEQKEDTHP